MASCDGREIHLVKRMGEVADVFTPEQLANLPGTMAIGHTRYSTAGDTDLNNAQPFAVSCNKGRIAVAHNGNLTNAAELRKELEDEGSIFQPPAIPKWCCTWWRAPRAHHRRRPERGAAHDGGRVFDGLPGRRPGHRGARSAGLPPLVMGQMELSGGKKCYVFASETCAFDLIGAVYLNEVARARW